MIISDGTTSCRILTRFTPPTNGSGLRVTTVRVMFGRGTYVGMAVCSARDQFVKEKGRRIALGRALRAAGLEREQRRALWTRYFAARAPRT